MTNSKFQVSFVTAAIVFLSVFSESAKAQSAALAADPATLAASASEQGAKRFAYSGQFLFETTRSANESDSASYSGFYEATGSVTHKRLALTATGRVGYTRAYSYENDDGTVGNFENPILSVAKSFLNERDFDLSWLDSVSLALNTAVGANAESRRRTLLWSNGLAVTGGKRLGRFNLRQAVGYTYGFYEYDIRDNGVVNSPHVARSTSTLYYDVSDSFSVGAMYSYAYSISFQGVGRAVQLAALTADYMLTDKMVASIGVSSERGTLEPDGQTNRVRLYAPESAQYFVDLVILL